MSGKATEIVLTEEEQLQLESWIRARTGEKRLVRRARIVLESASGKMTRDVACNLGLSPAIVSKWRKRFSEQRIWGLFDVPRPGTRHKYDLCVEQRVLAMLEGPPLDGQASWTGGLLAKALGDVSEDRVCRVLRKHSIHLRRRRSWCITIPAQVVSKAVDIVGLYLAPPRNALVLCVDGKASVGTSAGSQGCLCLYDRQALKRFTNPPHVDGQDKIASLSAALGFAADMMSAGDYSRCARREFLDFMNEITASWPGKEIHVLLDSMSPLSPGEGCWLKHHPGVSIHITPSHVSWINQVECLFGLLMEIPSDGAQDAGFACAARMRRAIDNFVAVYKRDAAPFEWRKGHCFSDSGSG